MQEKIAINANMAPKGTSAGPIACKSSQNEPRQCRIAAMPVVMLVRALQIAMERA